MKDNLYRVRDNDGDLYVVAPSFEEAIRRWEVRLRAENPDGWPGDTKLWPDEVKFIARGGDLVLGDELEAVTVEVAIEDWIRRIAAARANNDSPAFDKAVLDAAARMRR